MIYVTGPREKKIQDSQVIMTVSKANGWEKGLSPFILGPIEIDGVKAKNVENLWRT